VKTDIYFLTAAYYALGWAEYKTEERLTDQRAYDWLKENGMPDEEDNAELAREFGDYKLPSFPTWSRQVRNARKVLGKQKYTKRGDKKPGSGVVSGHDVEFQGDAS